MQNVIFAAESLEKDLIHFFSVWSSSGHIQSAECFSLSIRGSLRVSLGEIFNSQSSLRAFLPLQKQMTETDVETSAFSLLMKSRTALWISPQTNVHHLNMLRLLVVLVFAAGWTRSAADVGDFAPCLQFFYRSWPPKGLTGTPICQRYYNQYRFATLYSRPRRSPWFSAYLFAVPAGKRPSASWKFEPQLADPGAKGDMVPFPPGPLDQDVVDSQAVQLDYINSTFSRGHLNPSLHHQSHEDRAATFTLTNVVPQKAVSNDGPWEDLEQAVNKILAAYCLGEAYVVTGVIPYRSDERWLNKHRVAVPEYMWSAYCCPHYNKSLPEELKDAFPAFAAVGRNDRNSSEEIVPISKTAKKKFRGYDVRQMSLETLETYLKDRFGTVVSVFYERCSGSD